MQARMNSLRVTVLGLCLALGMMAVPLASSGAGDAALSGVVNINTATSQQLEILPGVGPVRAQAIVEERKRRGGFEKAEELLAIKGIGESSFAKLKPHVVLEGKTTAKLE